MDRSVAVGLGGIERWRLRHYRNILGELDAIREEILKMRQLTDKPFGVNVAQAVRDPGIVNFIIDQGVKFVTTSA